MPPPTSWNPVPHIYFLTWKTGVHRHLSTVQRVESSPPMTSCSLCGALPFDVNLCRNRRLHEENNIIWGSLCLGSRGSFNPLLPWSVNREPLSPPPPLPPLPSPSVTFLFSQEKKSTALHFHLCTQKFIFPIPVYSYLSHISPHILSPFSP